MESENQIPGNMPMVVEHKVYGKGTVKNPGDDMYVEDDELMVIVEFEGEYGEYIPVPFQELEILQRRRASSSDVEIETTMGQHALGLFLVFLILAKLVSLYRKYNRIGSFISAKKRT